MKKIFMCFIAASVLLACDNRNEPEAKQDDNNTSGQKEITTPDMTLEQMGTIALHTCLSQYYFSDMFVEATSEWMHYASSQSAPQKAAKYAPITETNGPDVSWDSANEQLVIDYGNKELLTASGNTIKGKILVKCTGNYVEKGTKVQVIAENLRINDATLSGTEVVENIGSDKNGNTCFNVKISNGEVQYADDTIQYEYRSESHRTWKIKGDTLNYLEHSYDIDIIQAVSIANGQWINFKTYNNDLLVVPVASYPTAGTLSVTLKEPVTIDFSKFIPAMGSGSTFTLDTFYVRFAEDSQVTISIMLPFMTEMIDVFTVKMSDLK